MIIAFAKYIKPYYEISACMHHICLLSKAKVIFLRWLLSFCFNNWGSNLHYRFSYLVQVKKQAIQ